MSTVQRSTTTRIRAITAAVAAGLIGSTLWLAPAEALDPDLTLVTTVTSDAGDCGTAQELEVAAGTTVFYCYRMTNVAEQSTVLLSTLTDSELGALLVDDEFQMDEGDERVVISPGVVITETVQSTAVWSATGVEGHGFTPAEASATVFVAAPEPTTTTTVIDADDPRPTPPAPAPPAAVVRVAPNFTG